jgi:ubiquinone/menaquinone biosynthesis C-methylase UbiE
MTLVDVGTGDGLIAFGAITRIGPSLSVILTDISAPLLEHARQLAIQLGVQGQCRFVLGSAEKLEGLADASADVVATRASLAYVPDKIAAFHEFHRVLKPGGRISLAEPIMQDDAFEACALGRLIAAQPDNPDIEFLRLLHRWKAAQYPATEEQVWRTPITNFSERDLVRLARQAGFVDIHMELHIDHRLTTAPEGGPPSPLASWELFQSFAPHPGAPSLRQVLAEKFTTEERQRFEQLMRPQVESHMWATSEVVAYLTADKPKQPTARFVP